MMQKIIPWILAIFVAFVFIQSLFFKFSGSEETVIIFNTIADWMADIALLEAVAEPFRTYSGNTIGVLELVASALILIPATRVLGALMGLGVLFVMACGVWLASAALVWLQRERLLSLLPAKAV